MSQSEASDTDASSTESTAPSESQVTGKSSSSSKKKASKSAKPRLTASQKNTNHKDAENKRRNAIRERFTELSKMVPGAEGQERSEQVMLGKTAEYLKDILQQQRELEALASQRGIVVDDPKKLRDDDFGGPDWRPKNLEAYEATKVKKGKLNTRISNPANGVEA